MEENKHWDVDEDYIVDVTNSITIFQRIQATDEELTLAAAAPELLEALQTYMSAVKRMNEAMNDGCNVHGAISGLIGAEHMAEYAIAKALGKE